MSVIFAERTSQMGASAIREILKVVGKPGMISLAGGIPAPESFPLEIISQLTESVLRKYGSAALQYDATEGFEPLRVALADYLSGMNLSAKPSEILVTSGSQSVLDALGMILISKGDKIAVESPTYLGALQAFRPYQPQFISLESDDQGLIPQSLEAALKRDRIKFVYLVPTFQNPTGRTLTYERRQAVADLIRRYDTLLVEDDPYSALRYCGVPLPPIKSMAPQQVVYAGSLSKVFAPGLRLGYCLARGEIRKWLVVAKQGIDLHTSSFNQALASEYISSGHLLSHLPKIIALYRPKLAAILNALKAYMPPNVKWSTPQGGMFIWLEGTAGQDTEAIYPHAVSRNVAFVPGKFFFASSYQGAETMRLNFTMASEGALTRAVKILAEVLKTSGADTTPVHMNGGFRQCGRGA